MGRTPRPQLFCSWFISRSVLPSGLHCPNLWPSGLLACVLHTDFSLSGDCHCLSFGCWYLPPLLSSHYCWATLRFIAISTFIGSYGVFAAISWFWLAASFVNKIISVLLPSRAVILCLRLDFLFIWFESFRLDLPSSSSWSISFVWKHYYVPVSLLVSRENLRHFFRPRIDKSICVKRQQ